MLRTRLTASLEELARLAAVKELERLRLRRAAEYERQRDEKQFVALLKEVETLAHALGVGRNGRSTRAWRRRRCQRRRAECDRSR